MSQYKKFSLCLHLDSLAESYSWPKLSVKDNAYIIGLQRITNILKKYNIPITVFVVGKDLENKNNVYHLRKFIDTNDVEIANHSYSHLFNLGSKNVNFIFDEIYKSHNIIYRNLKTEPVGFCSPSWNFSKNITSVLVKLNYKYDTSFFNSLWLYPMVAKIFLNHFCDFNIKKSLQILCRKDYFDMFKHYNKHFFLNCPNTLEKKILQIPMPSLSQFQIPIWHTVGFIFGFDFLEKKIKQFMNKSLFLNYVIHPADILIKNDLDNRFKNSWPRMKNNDIDYKISKLENVINLAKNNQYTFIKMRNYKNYLC